jgi:hypothetical protein
MLFYTIHTLTLINTEVIIALQLSYTSAQGFTSPEAYFKIVNLNWSGGSMSATLDIYKNSDARFQPLAVIASESHLVDLPFGGTVQDAYTYLKTQERFTGAIDA